MRSTSDAYLWFAQELNWCMRELAQLQKEKNDWRCNSWLETASGRSTILAAVPGQSPDKHRLISISSMNSALQSPQMERNSCGNGVQLAKGGIII